MQRNAITVQGVVQGVGFRPFVFTLASRLQLHGFVRNCSGLVQIEVEGDPQSLDRFLFELKHRPPPLARIDDLKCRAMPLKNQPGFRIKPSKRDRAAQVFISPDIASCDACLKELADPDDRRYRYPFLNCTNCGPRLTIIESAPYDRARTTMAAFPLCPACRAEYDDPLNRRFHAQPTACAKCGPHWIALKPTGEAIDTNDPLEVFSLAILQGKIGALKGLGGFHFVCDARNSTAVSELRRRKYRDEKPFAVMVAGMESARGFCQVNSQEAELLESPRRPIVLLKKRLDRSTSPNQLADAVAPGTGEWGVMLPYTPLHHLLLDAVGNLPLVLTSGNRSDEPIAYRDEEVIDQLGQIADVFLTHNRPIRVRCEDSVARVVARQDLILRRSRGYAPEPIPLPYESLRPLLAVGGQLKNVFALGKGRHAFLSHHVGDLDHFPAYQVFERDIALYEQLFEIRPELIVHDMHPDYASTEYARRRAKEEGVPTLAVQHHHAHMASVMAEHAWEGPVIGVTFDGAGYGSDGTIWGGEFLVGDYGDYRRATHFRSVRLPGGDQAVREPWRIAVAYLLDAGCEEVLIQGVSRRQRRSVERMIERGFHSPFTSSVGRLFDAAAAIAGVRTRVSYEGQAAMQWESLATDVSEAGHYPLELAESIDTRPLIRGIVHDLNQQTPIEIIARRFHSTLVEIIATVCRRIHSETGLADVALSGGVFLNVLLARETQSRLEAEGFRVLTHRFVPPGDGGLCLGQLAIAAKRLTREPSPPREAALHGENPCAWGSLVES